jgi:2-polyprenyl-3-methyl-5-hydroxy-6-metoxy-1,4-benzoquinol methylase
LGGVAIAKGGLRVFGNGLAVFYTALFQRLLRLPSSSVLSKLRGDIHNMLNVLSRLKGILKRTRLMTPVVSVYSQTIGRYRSMPHTSKFWEKRYAEGGNSGPGSYGRLAQFKADFINAFIEDNSIKTVIEFGCGDGNQLLQANYQSYIGFDVSQTAIDLCKKRFADDGSKVFYMLQEFAGQRADVTLSLDVIYHLVEEDVFERHMKALFKAAYRFVVIYSSNKDQDPTQSYTYIRHRKFTRWIEENIKGWRLKKHLPNPYPFKDDFQSESFADFYIFYKE